METAKLFQNGKSQAVRLPRKYRFAGDRVLIKKMGNVVMLIPDDDPWHALIESLKMFSPDFMAERAQPDSQPRENPFV